MPNPGLGIGKSENTNIGVALLIDPASEECFDRSPIKDLALH